MWVSDLGTLFFKSVIIPPVSSDKEAGPSKGKNDSRLQNKMNGWATEKVLGESLSSGQSHWPKRRRQFLKPVRE